MVTADEVASVIIARLRRPSVDAWSLQKLLYYVQAWHLAVTDTPLFDDTIEAWKDGPVVREVRRIRLDPATRRSAAQRVDDNLLSDYQSTFIDMVLANYGSMTGQELRALTHVESPWCEARGNLPAEAPSNEPITHASMARFYRLERRLGGRTAADLAAAGVYMRARRETNSVDVEDILKAQDANVQSAGDDRWGGANWDRSEYDTSGLVKEFRRARPHE